MSSLTSGLFAQRTENRPSRFLLDVIVPGQPVGKGRPIFAKRGKFVTARTPDKTLSWEHGAELRFRDAWSSGALDEALVVEVHAVCKRPKSLCRAKDPVGRMPCVSKPDLDNIAKIVMDALVLAHIMTDDTRVVELRARKQYAAIGEQEHVRVILTRYSGESHV